MYLIFYDVGHGSCTHLITPNGKHILFDIGGSDDWSPAKYMRDILHVQQLDALFITHPHIDHFYDIDNLVSHGLKPIIISRVKEAFPVEKTNKNKAFHNQIEIMNDISATYTSPVPADRDPLLSKNNGGVDISLFYPDSKWITPEDPNTFSGLYVVEYAGIKIVLTGDNNKEILAEMVKCPGIFSKLTNADYLLAPHHGRETDYCDEFFQIVNPKITIISDKSIVHNSQEQSSNLYHGRGKIVESDVRYVMTTRKDGNIILIINQNGSDIIKVGEHNGY